MLTKMMKNDEEEAVRKAMMSDTVHVHVHVSPSCRSSCVVVMMTTLPDLPYLVHDYSFRGKSHIDDISLFSSVKYI